MKKINLGECEWQMSGWTPEMWRLVQSMELGSASKPEVAPIRCQVPGSVQNALRQAGCLPDWNVGLNSRACEWVENRHWMFQVELPEFEGGARLRLEGLDGAGEVWFGERRLLEFHNAFLRYEVEIPEPRDSPGSRVLKVVFFCPPRWLGQVGFTSQIKDWKPRFNYTWDWVARNVQIGIFGQVFLLLGKRPAWEGASFDTTYDPLTRCGAVRLQGLTPAEGQSIRVRLWDGDRLVAETSGCADSLELDAGPVEAWFPNGSGPQRLYRLEVGDAEDCAKFSVGFRHVEWQACEGAAPDADPWICRINGKDTFLQGINWTPIRPHFADLRREDYEERLKTYHELGFNTIRVWGGGFAEYDWLYEICDQLGLLVWQDFPLSSSGIDNWPPEDPRVINEAEQIARQMVSRLKRHPCLLLWCGGNELQGAIDGGKTGIGKPAPRSHPMLSMFERVVQAGDPGRRFVETTSSGPRFTAEGKDFGRNLHWDVHGPWDVEKVDLQPWQDYWRLDDALFRSEMGNPGAQPADLIREFLGACDFQEASLANPYWQRVSFWFELDVFLAAMGGQPWEIEDYVRWSQSRQAEKLAFAIKTFKARFPACGGLILWMGHDSFPCPVNTSLLDFYGRPKPVCDAIRAVLHASPDDLSGQAS